MSLAYGHDRWTSYRFWRVALWLGTVFVLLFYAMAWIGVPSSEVTVGTVPAPVVVLLLVVVGAFLAAVANAALGGSLFASLANAFAPLAGFFVVVVLATLGGGLPGLLEADLPIWVFLGGLVVLAFLAGLIAHGIGAAIRLARI